MRVLPFGGYVLSVYLEKFINSTSFLKEQAGTVLQKSLPPVALGQLMAVAQFFTAYPVTSALSSLKHLNCINFSRRIYSLSHLGAPMLNELLGTSLNLNFQGKAVFCAPIIEEGLFRFGLQEVVLRRAPKAILKKIAPAYTSKVDSKIAKVARVLFTTFLFTIAHDNKSHIYSTLGSVEKCASYNVGLGVVFIAGLVFGSIQERTHSTASCILCHMVNNAMGALIQWL